MHHSHRWTENLTILHPKIWIKQYFINTINYDSKNITRLPYFLAHKTHRIPCEVAETSPYLRNLTGDTVYTFTVDANIRSTTHTVTVKCHNVTQRTAAPTVDCIKCKYVGLIATTHTVYKYMHFFIYNLLSMLHYTCNTTCYDFTLYFCHFLRHLVLFI